MRQASEAVAPASPSVADSRGTERVLAVPPSSQAARSDAGRGGPGGEAPSPLPTSLTLVLDPPGLGTVHVTVAARGEAVSAAVVLPDQPSADALRQVEPQVRAALAAHGLTLDQFQLSHQLGDQRRPPPAQDPGFVARRPRIARAFPQVALPVARVGRLDLVA